MQISSQRNVLFFVAALLAISAAAPAQESQASKSGAGFAAVTLSDGTVIPNRPTPTLHFTDAQRAQIRAVVDQRSGVADFPLGTSAAAAQFKPAVGAAVPKTLESQTLPPPLLAKMPMLNAYTYIRLSDQAVIVDPMSHKVAEIVTLP